MFCLGKRKLNVIDFTPLPIPFTLEQVPALAKAYSAAIEVEKTNDWCRCKWIIHPDDTAVARNRCRECGEKPTDEIHQGLDILGGCGHRFRGARMRKGDQAWDCPVHTKEGFIIYFFQWVIDNAGK